MVVVGARELREACARKLGRSWWRFVGLAGGSGRCEEERRLSLHEKGSRGDERVPLLSEACNMHRERWRASMDVLVLASRHLRCGGREYIKIKRTQGQPLAQALELVRS